MSSPKTFEEFWAGDHDSGDYGDETFIDKVGVQLAWEEAQKPLREALTEARDGFGHILYQLSARNIAKSEREAEERRTSLDALLAQQPAEQPAEQPAGVEGVGIRRIAAERVRQISEEGYSSGHDEGHRDEELPAAAARYALAPLEREELDVTHFLESIWPEEWEFRPSPDNRIRELEKAGALIAAEIDRLASEPAGTEAGDKEART